MMKRQLQARVANRDKAPMQVFSERLEQLYEAVQAYERAHKNRAGVLSATERELANA